MINIISTENKAEEILAFYKEVADLMHKSYWTLTVDDYHTFKCAVVYYKAAGIDAKYEEVGCNGQYEAVFWVGKKPTKHIEQRKQYYKTHID